MSTISLDADERESWIQTPQWGRRISVGRQFRLCVLRRSRPIYRDKHKRSSNAEWNDLKFSRKIAILAANIDTPVVANLSGGKVQPRENLVLLCFRLPATRQELSPLYRCSKLGQVLLSEPVSNLIHHLQVWHWCLIFPWKLKWYWAVVRQFTPLRTPTASFSQVPPTKYRDLFPPWLRPIHFFTRLGNFTCQSCRSRFTSVGQ